MAGRKPKPTKLKELAGNPGKRKLNTAEPLFTGEAKCPTHLDKLAKAEWRRAAPHLINAGILTAADQTTFAGYCHAYSVWVQAKQLAAQQGMVVISPKSGFPMQNPYIGIANTAAEHMRKFAAEFGMTPSSRTRVQVTAAPNKGDAFEQFMASMGAEELHDEADELQRKSN